MFIQKVSGHTRAKTFSRYVNPTNENITDIADALTILNDKSETQNAPAMVN